MSEIEEFFRLDDRETTLILRSVDAAVPEILYWGSPLRHDADGKVLAGLQRRPLTFASLDREAPLSLVPEESRGFAGMPGLAVHRPAGHYAHQLKLNAARTVATRDRLVFELDDTRTGAELGVQLTITLQDGVVSLRNRLENRGASLLTIEHCAAATLPLPLAYQELLLMHGRWGGEFQSERQTLGRAAAVQIDNHSGRTSPDHFPGVVVGEKGFGEQRGQLMGVHLGWSGNYRLRLERLADGRGYLQASEYFLPGELILAAGESYQSPILYATRAQGLNEMSQTFHRFVRRHILPTWTRQPRPLGANSWEAVYFDHRLPRLKEIIEAAAATGIERFILDDGWFMGRRHDRAGLGDWRVDPAVYPKGLGPLIAHVHKHQMSFGLWVEPEMVNPDSELYRAHPDWVLQAPGFSPVTGRQQLVLNLSHPPAYAHIRDSLRALLDAYPIAFLKWDMNRILVMPAQKEGRAAAHAQMMAVYRLLDELREAYPALEIESCASGGGRADFEILRRTGRIWTSDNIDPLTRAGVQRGFSLFFPPEVMGAHIGAEKAHITGRKTDAHLRAIVALQGQLGFELDLSQTSDEERQIYREYIEVYKRERSWIAEAAVYRLELSDAALSGVGYVSQDQSRSLWWVIARDALQSTIPEPVYFLGLKPEATYRLRLENKNRDALQRYMQTPTPLLGVSEDLIVSGELLMRVGLSLPVLPPAAALLISCNLVDQKGS